MAVRPEEITSILKEQIEKFGAEVTATNVGTVIDAGDGIARVHGLSNVMASELVEFPSADVMGLVLNLGEENVGVMILGDYTKVKGGDLICIYVAIGQKASKVAQVVGVLEERGAMEHTIVVSATAADAAALQFLAPYAGCAMGGGVMAQ